MKKDKSIIPNNDGYCFICKKLNRRVEATDRHHMLYGSSKRALSEADGLYVNLCHPCHMRLHQDGEYKEELQKLAELTWCEHYKKSVDDFIKRYGKNYLI